MRTGVRRVGTVGGGESDVILAGHGSLRRARGWDGICRPGVSN